MRHDLIPATPDEMQQELTACLALCGASGMSEDDRTEWLSAARLTLADLPADLLSYGCEHARRTCDHPSKIVPAIIAETEQRWAWRREPKEAAQPRIEGQRPPRSVGALMDARGKPMTEEEAGRLNGHLESIGSPARYRPDGSKSVAR